MEVQGRREEGRGEGKEGGEGMGPHFWGHVYAPGPFGPQHRSAELNAVFPVPCRLFRVACSVCLAS